MSIVTIQECRSLDGWQPVEVKSSKDPDSSYVVMLNPWGSYEDNICECKGYQFRGQCRHQHIALGQICGWREEPGEAVQTDEQRANKVCPKCKNKTRWVMEVVE